jgi:hypothetical protein
VGDFEIAERLLPVFDHMGTLYLRNADPRAKIFSEFRRANSIELVIDRLADETKPSLNHFSCLYTIILAHCRDTANPGDSSLLI